MRSLRLIKTSVKGNFNQSLSEENIAETNSFILLKKANTI